MASGSYFGKYREIVLAVACFLIFDMAVLVLNFYISYQISESAVSINLAGRQRMLSQRMTKSLLGAQADINAEQSPDKALAELNKTVALFDATLSAFRAGGQVSGSTGEPVSLQPIRTPKGLDILQKSEALWLPYRQALSSVINIEGQQAVDTVALAQAVAYARQHNIDLLTLMNDLTTHLEQEASARADTLRQVQTGGIVLALLNFLFILFKFLRRLNANDRKIEAAQRETAEILSTVKEGLFLLDSDFRIGQQYSASLPAMLGKAITAGADFREILQSLVAPAVFESACSYIELLLAGRVKESLVAELNPLSEVAVKSLDATGAVQQRYLTLQFSRSYVDGEISHLLVTVFDVTIQVELEQALQEARKKAKADVEVMLDLLKVNPRQLRRFLGEAEQTLLDINEQLRNAGSERDYRTTINQIFGRMHALKGDAAAIGLQMFEELAHEFERLLADLRGKGAVTGQDLIALPLPLDEFLSRISAVRDLAMRLAAYNNGETTAMSEVQPAIDPHAEANGEANLLKLAQRIANSQGKRVNLISELALLESMPEEQRKHVYDIALQLLRNAIVHGIESEADRLKKQKAPIGNIYLGVHRDQDGHYELILRDDGAGIDAERIRQALIESGRYSSTQLDAMSERDIVLKIFEAGVSTAQALSVDAGHGVGMDVVRQKVRALGAKLRVVSRPQLFTKFSVHFAA
ncbi:MAG: type IV pili methyl-accepting chemotaxis transducer N-terminal domain-containing protein [Spongiibacteraceae bacterium]